MASLTDTLSFAAFNAIAFFRGYTFKEVVTEQERADFDMIYNEEGFSFPEELMADIQRFKAGTLNYIAYKKGVPAGLVRMANPKVINRAYEHYGVDKEGKHPEIQSLVVRKQFRDGTQFVMLGLVKKIYTYSLAHGITTWSACGKRNMYMTMRRYCKDIEVIDVDFKSVDHPVTRFLCANDIIETYFVMQVAAFAPGKIFKKLAKKVLKNITGKLNINLKTPKTSILWHVK